MGLRHCRVVGSVLYGPVEVDCSRSQFDRLLDFALHHLVRLVHELCGLVTLEAAKKQSFSANAQRILESEAILTRYGIPWWSYRAHAEQTGSRLSRTSGLRDCD